MPVPWHIHTRVHAWVSSQYSGLEYPFSPKIGMNHTTDFFLSFFGSMVAACFASDRCDDMWILSGRPSQENKMRRSSRFFRRPSRGFCSKKRPRTKIHASMSLKPAWWGEVIWVDVWHTDRIWNLMCVADSCARKKAFAPRNDDREVASAYRSTIFGGDNSVWQKAT